MLTAQLNELLACSSDMRSILSPYISGQANLTINVGSMTEDPRSVMETEVDSSGNAVITINSMCITENGFDAYTYGKDNAGYQNDGTAACMFSTAMAHEALHAKHYYWYFESKNNTKSDSEAVQYLKDQGFSDEFVSVFYTNNEGSWSSIMDTQGTGVVSENEHNYFKNHNLGVLDLVRNDFDNRYNLP